MSKYQKTYTQYISEIEAEAHQEFCDPLSHEWYEGYYGWRCKNCQDFIPYGCEPWAVDDCEDGYPEDTEY